MAHGKLFGGNSEHDDFDGDHDGVSMTRHGSSNVSWKKSPEDLRQEAENKELEMAIIDRFCKSWKVEFKIGKRVGAGFRKRLSFSGVGTLEDFTARANAFANSYPEGMVTISSIEPLAENLELPEKTPIQLPESILTVTKLLSEKVSD